MEKFEQERRDIRINYTAKEYLRSDELLNKNWNGREIRNGETVPQSEVSGCADLFLSMQCSREPLHKLNTKRRRTRRGAVESC